MPHPSVNPDMVLRDPFDSEQIFGSGDFDSFVARREVKMQKVFIAAHITKKHIAIPYEIYGTHGCVS